jgi:hypothetical protein
MLIDRSAEGQLSFTELLHIRDVHKDQQIIRDLRTAGVSLRGLEKSFAALAASDPMKFMQLHHALQRQGVIIKGRIDQQRVQQLVKSGTEFHTAHERFTNSFWGLTGKVVELAKRYSPTALAVMAYKQMFGTDSLYARTLATNLQTTGGLADQTGMAVLQQSMAFADMEASIVEQLRRYGLILDKHEASKITKEYAKYFGTGAAGARQIMSRLAATAKMTDTNVDELFDILIQQHKTYGQGALKTAAELHLNTQMFRRTANLLTSNEMFRSYMDGKGMQTVWPSLMQETFMQWQKGFTETGASVQVIGKLVALSYEHAAKHGKMQKRVQREADTYVHMLKGADWMRIGVGINVLERLERKVKEVQIARTGITEAEAVHQVLIARYGANQLGIVEPILRAFMRGERAYTPEAIMQVDQSLDDTLLETTTEMQKLWQQMSTHGVMQHALAAGADYISAFGTALTVEQGGLLRVEQQAKDTRSQSQRNLKLLHDSADFLVESDITATTVIQRVMAMAQRWLATPLGKLAAATGILGTKLALDGYYKVTMIMDWFRAALAYARMAGLTTAAGLIAHVKLELLKAGQVLRDMRSMAGAAGRIIIPAALLGLAATRAPDRAQDNVTASMAANQAMKVVGQRRVPQLPGLATPEELDPAKIAERAERDASLTEMAKRQNISQLDITRQPEGALVHPVYQDRPFTMNVMQLPPQPPTPAERTTGVPSTSMRPMAELRTVQFAPRSELESQLLASGIPLTSTGRIAISTLARIESSRRMSEMRELWISAMGGRVHRSETGREVVRVQFADFARMVSGVYIHRAFTISRRI